MRYDVGQKMKRIAVAIIVGGLVYVAGVNLSSFILRRTGNHTWSKAQNALRRLEESAVRYTAKHGHPPDAVELNGEIEKVWVVKKTWIDSMPPDLDHDLADILYFLAMPENDLRKFEQPPRFVVNSNLPNGCGFFWAGEDGTTSTNGRDPDDINSWDNSSDGFYYDRANRKTAIRDDLIALPPALFAAWFTGRKKTTNKSRHRTGVNGPL